VRRTIASTYLESTRPVSSIVSPRPSCSSDDVSASACPPADATATSKETRVLVEGFSKIIPTDLPRSLSP
jgi:hypothetical protein